ncbi:hypothetical protein BDFB_015094, partial [Asbolus verrucosus]
LKENLLHPYHIQRVQSLSPNDFPPRRFCRWFQRKITDNPLFHATILMTDECCFTRDGILNYHNTHYWMNSQYRFSVNIWAGIVGTQLIGPYVLPRRLTGEAYLNFLQFNLPELLEEVPLNIRQNLWFMH